MLLDKTTDVFGGLDYRSEASIDDIALVSLSSGGRGFGHGCRCRWRWRGRWGRTLTSQVVMSALRGRPQAVSRPRSRLCSGHILKSRCDGCVEAMR